MGAWQRISSRWSKGDLEAAAGDARDNDRPERGQDEEEFEGRIFGTRARATPRPS